MDGENRMGFTGLWIPRHIWEMKELPVSARILCAEIEALAAGAKDQGQPGCYKRTETFAEEYGVTTTTVKAWLNLLREAGLIDTVKWDGRRRFIDVTYAVARPKTRRAARPKTGPAARQETGPAARPKTGRHKENSKENHKKEEETTHDPGGANAPDTCKSCGKKLASAERDAQWEGLCWKCYRLLCDQEWERKEKTG